MTLTSLRDPNVSSERSLVGTHFRGILRLERVAPGSADEGVHNCPVEETGHLR